MNCGVAGSHPKEVAINTSLGGLGGLPSGEVCTILGTNVRFRL